MFGELSFDHCAVLHGLSRRFAFFDSLLYHHFTRVRPNLDRAGSLTRPDLCSALYRLKTPLTLIKGPIYDLSKSETVTKRKKVFSLAMRNINRLARLVRSLDKQPLTKY